MANQIITGTTDFIENVASESWGIGTDVPAWVNVDIIVPTLTITTNASSITVGETATLTFTFSEGVTGFDINDVVATLGAISGFSGSDALYTATYTPPTNTSSIVNVSVSDDSYTNTNGNDGVGDSIAITINTSLPVENITVASGAHKTITNQKTSAYARRVYIGNVEAYSINVSEWLSGEAITSTGILCEDGGVIVGYNDEVDGLISVLVTGASVGGANVIFDYSTATRNTCTKMIIKVVNSC